MLTIGPFYAVLGRNHSVIGSYGTTAWLPWAAGVAIRNSFGAFDPNLSVHVGSVDEPCGFSVTSIFARRKPNGCRLMRMAIGGANPKLLRWL